MERINSENGIDKWVEDVEKTEEFYQQLELSELERLEQKEVEKALAVDVLTKASKTSLELISENSTTIEKVKKNRKKM